MSRDRALGAMSAGMNYNEYTAPGNQGADVNPAPDPLRDPIAEIIQRIYKLKYSNAKGSGNSAKIALAEGGEEHALQQYLDEMQEERRRASMQSRQNVPKMRSAPPPGYSQGGMGSMGSQFGQEDDNSRARRRAVEAAMKYMSIKNPHLISSLGLGRK
jgi:hypothetical protein